MTKIINPDGNPFGHDNSIVDTRGAILLADIDVVAITNPSDGRDLIGLQLAGRVNRSSARTQVLYLFDADGAAAIVSELVGLAQRGDEKLRADFTAALDARMANLPTQDGDR